jgi:hypothetical protein
MDLERSDHVQIMVLYQSQCGGTEENHQTSQSGYAVFWPKFETRLDRWHCAGGLEELAIFVAVANDAAASAPIISGLLLLLVTVFPTSLYPEMCEHGN